MDEVEQLCTAVTLLQPGASVHLVSTTYHDGAMGDFLRAIGLASVPHTVRGESVLQAPYHSMLFLIHTRKPEGEPPAATLVEAALQIFPQPVGGRSHYIV